MTHYLRHATTTTAQVQARFPAGGVLGLQVNGQSFAGSVCAAGTDWTALVTATGLAPGMTYTATLTLDGVPMKAINLRTMPAAGSPLWIVGTSCVHQSRPVPALDAVRAMAGDQLAAFVSQGDIPYLTTQVGNTASYGWFGDTTVDLERCGNVGDQATVKANVRAHHRIARVTPGIRETLERVPSYFIPSDHDIAPADNVYTDATLATYNAYHAGTFSTLEQGQQVRAWCLEVWRQEYAKGNAPNAHASRDTSWAAEEQTYFDAVIGDLHVLFLDTITYRVGSPANFLGATQLAWAQSVLAASTSLYRVLMTDAGPTEYSASVPADLATLWDWIDAQGITGTVCMSGDIHSMMVRRGDKVATVRGGPASQSHHLDVPNGYPGAVVYKELGFATNGITSTRALHTGACHYARVDPQAGRLYLGIVDGNGSLRWGEAYLTPQSNALSYVRAARL